MCDSRDVMAFSVGSTYMYSIHCDSWFLTKQVVVDSIQYSMNSQQHKAGGLL